jgi:hypothetical protein
MKLTSTSDAVFIDSLNPGDWLALDEDRYRPIQVANQAYQSVELVATYPALA